MSIYEGMFLVDNRHANRDWSRVVDIVKGLVTKHGGEVVRLEKWGERKLAYPIRGNKRGTYLLAYFTAEGEAPNAIYRDAQISFHDTFLRALILQVDAVPEEKKEEKPPVTAVGAPTETAPAEDAKAPAGSPETAPAAVEEKPAEAAVEPETAAEPDADSEKPDAGDAPEAAPEPEKPGDAPA